MLGSDEARGFGDGNALFRQVRAHFGVVQHRSQNAGVAGSMPPTARTAIQGGSIGVVLRGAAMTAQHHQWREMMGEAHHPQCAFGISTLLSEGDVFQRRFNRQWQAKSVRGGGLKSGRELRREAAHSHPYAARHAQCLHQRKRGGEGVFHGLIKPLEEAEARIACAIVVMMFMGARRFRYRVFWRQQHWARGMRFARDGIRDLHGQTEKSGEAERLVIAGGF